MRIFIALDIPDEIRQKIVLFMEGVLEFAPDARWVRPESLHVTLKFIGEKSAESVEEIKQELSTIRAKPFDLNFHGCGFFPNPRSARVFWIGIQSGLELAALARTIDETTNKLGISKEEHVFSPHLTLARGGRGSGAPGWRKGDRTNSTFQKLQERLNGFATAEFGTMTAREFFMYESKLMRGGSKYTKIARFELSSAAKS